MPTSEFGLRVNEDKRAQVLGGKAPYVRTNSAAPIHNSAVGWWRLLEFVPRFRWRSDGRYIWAMNLFAPRRRPADAMYHPSVEEKLKRGGYSLPT